MFNRHVLNEHFSTVIKPFKDKSITKTFLQPFFFCPGSVSIDSVISQSAADVFLIDVILRNFYNFQLIVP